jgi:hypothetical protein
MSAPDGLILVTVKHRFPWRGVVAEPGNVLQMLRSEADCLKELVSLENITVTQRVATKPLATPLRAGMMMHR